ncbi:MAG TPA: 6-phosphogluconolactonase [Gaiellaceae bacterium]|jgi:6-phosphogluconolactonase
MTAEDVEIVIADQPAQVVAGRLAAAARSGGHVVLTGGSTPRVAYELAAKLEPDWTRVELWWGDERCVPPDDELSNYGLAKLALLDHVATGIVHRMRGELGPEDGAAQYDEELGSVEQFDLMLLGLGPDGHTASLFPSQPTLDVIDRRAIGAKAQVEPFVDRITLTLPMLRNAREVLFLVAGADKAEACKRAFGSEPSHATPGSLVRAIDGITTAVLDPAAAALL